MMLQQCFGSPEAFHCVMSQDVRFQKYCNEILIIRILLISTDTGCRDVGLGETLLIGITLM